MLRTDTGNFNRFLTSIGLLMIAGALVIPYFYFQETETLRVSRAELRGLTSTGREALKARQGRVSNFEVPILILAGLLIASGAAAIALGGRRLRIAQEKEDAAVDRRAQREDYEIQQLSKEEVEEKRDEQAREVVREEPDDLDAEGTEAEPTVDADREVLVPDGPAEADGGAKGRREPEPEERAVPRTGDETKPRQSSPAASGEGARPTGLTPSSRLAQTRAQIARIEERAGGALSERVGDSYVYRSEVKIVSGRRRVNIDALFEAKGSRNRRDVVTEFKTVLAPRGLRGRARLYTDELVALLARYENVTGREALGWLVVMIPEGTEEEPTVPLPQIEHEFTEMLMGLGRCSVIVERDLAQLPQEFTEIFGA